jgi:hypothetical protein
MESVLRSVKLAGLKRTSLDPRNHELHQEFQ